MDFNKWTVTGRLTRDPKDISKEGADKKVAILSIASNYRDKENGEWVDKVLYVDFPTFGRQAENCLKYLAKGSRVLVSGRAGVRSWESEGKSGHVMTCFPDDVLFLDTKKKDSGEEAPF